MVEREALATHAAVALALLALPWALTSPSRRLSLWAWTSPFLALVLMPEGLRRYSPLVLVACSIAVLWAWLLHPDRHHAFPATRTTGRARAFSLAVWASAGASLAILLRPDAVAVPFDLVHCVGIALRGAALGGAVAWLLEEWRDHDDGHIRALTLAVAAMVTSGPSVTAALVLAATAGTSAWMRRRSGASPTALGWITLVPWPALAGLSPATATLLGFGAWGARVRRGWLAALIVVTALGALWLEPRPWLDTATDLGFAAMLFGPVWLAQRSQRNHPPTSRLWQLASATALAIVGLRFFPSHLVLVPVAAQILRPIWNGHMGGAEASEEENPSAGTIVEPRRISRHGVLGGLSGLSGPSGLALCWLASWAVATLLLASYPWMRPPMLAAQWRWALDQDADTILPLLLFGTVAALLLVVWLKTVTTRAERRHWPRGGVAMAALCAVLSIAAWSWREPLGAQMLQRWPPRTVSTQSPFLLHPLVVPRSSNAPPVVWIDGVAAASLDVPAGTTAATVSVDLPSGRWEGDLVLGRDLWDWRLPSPRTTHPDAGPPAPMSFWWTGSLDDAILARRYRARLDLERTGDGKPPWRLRVDRNPALPPATSIELQQIGIRGAQPAEDAP